MRSTLESIQIAGHPSLPRKRWDDLQLNNPTILVVGNNHPPLTIGEQYLIDQSDYIGSFAKSKLYSLSPSDWKVLPARIDSTLILQETFEAKGNRNLGINGSRAFQTSPGRDTIWSGNLPLSDSIENIEVSIWYHMDTKSYHLPVLRINCDPSGKNFFNRSSRDVLDGWTRHSIKVPYCNSLQVTIEGDKGFLFDNLEIRKVE